MKCPICDTENRAGVIVCENCHADLYTALLETVSTKQLAKDRERELLIDPNSSRSNPIILYVRSAPEPIAVSRGGTLVMGRIDPEDDSVAPDIDFQPYDAQELGVSRRHLKMDTTAQPLTVTDLDSYNGTFLNGQQLNAQQSYTLQSGDEIRMGHMIIRVFYEH